MIFSQSFLVSLEHSFLVELVNLNSKVFFGLVSLNFHCVGQDSFIQERLSLKVEVFYLLESLEAALLSNLVQVNHKFGTDGLVLA